LFLRLAIFTPADMLQSMHLYLIHSLTKVKTPYLCYQHST